ncbi:hypothetical protein [Aggregatibacter actinomycetemcomitans]|uniref:hypothetical protein n=1 Tax=Aggregatibacter actinomycetemcomitans TaxID=714 RepID=UPI00197BA697|nr:hypothetical protein [Aggregatibacter actinomycetemcomitans]MBN6063243.1 hypothetical protein [Aggregatibacter actinomycetemcomitans]MBN6083117.1 hypothetical protein [Aggregatibacter actinomycetemcomitans]
MNLHDFQKLLLNRNEIEQALGINLAQALAADEQYLNDYAMFSTIPLEDVTAIFLGLNPANQSHNKKHPRYQTVFNAVETAVRRGEINAEVEQEFDINGNEYRFDISLSHDVAKAWAKAHNLQWNVSPYRPVTRNDEVLEFNQSVTDTKKDEIIEELRAENAGLKARIVELESQPQKQGAVNYDDFSIYGHTTTEIKAIFAVIQRYWINHDIRQPDTIANADDIKKWIRENFPEISNTNAEAIQKITRPLEAKFIGRK